MLLSLRSLIWAAQLPFEHMCPCPKSPGQAVARMLSAAPLPTTATNRNKEMAQDTSILTAVFQVWECPSWQQAHGDANSDAPLQALLDGKGKDASFLVTEILPSVPFTRGCFSSIAAAVSASTTFGAGAGCFFERPCTGSRVLDPCLGLLASRRTCLQRVQVSEESQGAPF